ncbi:hypothetical protein FN846DRAFT_909406 [Sphaerosporella brunnea]|uniref:Uncharacterized protein n=1 Tax=Sphaerosporella brunnea TaxID=1250544 RepID=A0A5J5EQR3_9PEZI|nr:hypothetical protein FN846DRAFT_909406 [Sphaerosporella brunnea]
MPRRELIRTRDAAPPPGRQRKRSARIQPGRPHYKDHDSLCVLLAILPRDKFASQSLRRQAQDICRQDGYELKQNYTSWGEQGMEKLVKTVTDKMNAKPDRNTVFTAEAIRALLRRICLDNVRKKNAAKEKKLQNDPADGDGAVPLPWQENDISGPPSDDPVPASLQERDMHISLSGIENDGASGAERDGSVSLPLQEDDISDTPSNNPVSPPVQERGMHISLGGAEGDGSVSLPLQKDNPVPPVDGAGSSGPSLDPKRSILIKFVDTIRPPMVVPRVKPFYMVYHQLGIVLGLNTDWLLITYVPGRQSSWCNLTDQTWRRLVVNNRVQSLMLILCNFGFPFDDCWMNGVGGTRESLGGEARGG